MKNYAKVGNRQGKPGYRTPATFRIRKAMKVMRAKISMPYKNFK